MSEIRILKNEWLPPMTMMVGPELYHLLTDTPEQAAQRNEAMLAQVTHFSEMMKRVSGQRFKKADIDHE